MLFFLGKETVSRLQEVTVGKRQTVEIGRCNVDWDRYVHVIYALRVIDEHGEEALLSLLNIAAGKQSRFCGASAETIEAEAIANRLVTRRGEDLEAYDTETEAILIDSIRTRDSRMSVPRPRVEPRYPLDLYSE